MDPIASKARTTVVGRLVQEPRRTALVGANVSERAMPGAPLDRAEGHRPSPAAPLMTARQKS